MDNDINNAKFHITTNEGLHSSYRLPNTVKVIKSRRLRWVAHLARMEEGRNSFKIITGTSAGKRPRHRWEENIRMDLK